MAKQIENIKKKILGLDLGTTSLGWSLIEENEVENSKSIIDLGVRIIPYNENEGEKFIIGISVSKNAERTIKRAARRSYDRYQQRRYNLIKALKNEADVSKNMMPEDELIKLDKIKLWELRCKAVNEQISLKELGRIFLWLNQKRGYKSARSEANKDKKDTDNIKEYKNRSQILKDNNLTIGQFFYNKLKENNLFRTKEEIHLREDYINEFDKICIKQQAFYPHILSNDFINKIRNEIIYYQRKLKSQKNLVSVCEFEGIKKEVKDKNGEIKIKLFGPKVAHKSNPLFQICKIWETINNMRPLQNYFNKTINNIIGL